LVALAGDDQGLSVETERIEVDCEVCLEVSGSVLREAFYKVTVKRHGGGALQDSAAAAGCFRAAGEPKS